MPAKLLIVCYIIIGKSKITNIANERRNRKEGDKECGIKRRKKHRIEG